MPAPAEPICPVTGKRSFPTRAAARAANRLRNGGYMSAYRCLCCEWWHVTSGGRPR